MIGWNVVNYQTLHLSSVGGFILLLTGQLNVLANSNELCKAPMILKKKRREKKKRLNKQTKTNTSLRIWKGHELLINVRYDSLKFGSVPITLSFKHCRHILTSSNKKAIHYFCFVLFCFVFNFSFFFHDICSIWSVNILNAFCEGLKSGLVINNCVFEIKGCVYIFKNVFFFFFFFHTLLLSYS